LGWSFLRVGVAMDFSICFKNKKELKKGNKRKKESLSLGRKNSIVINRFPMCSSTCSQ